MKRLILPLLFLAAAWSSPVPGLAQAKYWIFFDGKPGQDPQRTYVSARTVANRQALGLAARQLTDVPVSPAYLDRLHALRIPVVNRSRWLNAASARLTAGQAAAVRALPFVKGVQPVAGNLRPAGASAGPQQNYAMEQMNIGALHRKKLTGRGVVVGLIDGNFARANQNQGLGHLFAGGRILGTRDFVETPGADFFDPPPGTKDLHGHFVLLHLAGYNPESRQAFGPAPDASFYLARTEDSGGEYRREEDNWIVALEWLDSLGVRLVNSSLGYSHDFTDPAENHAPEQMDGKTTPITKAAAIAVREKGMILVLAAGNDGSNEQWRVVAAPADAEGVISVGATDRYWKKPDWSAIGPDFTGYLKPNVSCFSDKGNSYSAPLVTGLIACLLQRSPALSPADARTLVEKSGHLYPDGNNFMGYGVPDAARALALLKDAGRAPGSPQVIRADGNQVVLDAREEVAVAFHKRDEFITLKQELLTPVAGKFTVKQVAGTRQTTLSSPERLIRIIWQETTGRN